MPRATQEQSELTARDIRAVAAKHFSEHGFAATSLEAVAAEAGVTRGAVYHHFRNKNGLFTSVVADAQSVVAASVAEAATSNGWQGLADGSIAFMRAVISPDVRRILLVDAPAVLGWSEWRQMDAEHSGALLVEGLGELDDLAITPEAAAALLNGAMNEAALWIVDGGDSAQAEAGLIRLLGSLRAA